MAVYCCTHQQSDRSWI